MVVPPKDGLVALQFYEVVVALGLQALDYLVGLEPCAVKHQQVAYISLDLTQRPAVLVGKQDKGVLCALRQLAKDVSCIPAFLIVVLAHEGVKLYLVREESHWGN